MAMLALPGLGIYVTEVNSESLKTVRPSLSVSWNQSLQVTPAECLKIIEEAQQQRRQREEKDNNERNGKDGCSHSRFPVQLWKYSCATMP